MKKLLFFLLRPFLAYAAEEIPYGQAYPFEQCFVDNTTGIALESTITFQDADITISQNGTEASPAGTAARFNDNGKCFDFNLLSTETDTPFVTAIFVDNAGDVWMPVWRNFITVGHPSAGIVSKEPYNFAVVADAGGTTTTTNFTAAASGTNDYYNNYVFIVYDTSEATYYETTVSAYNGTTKIATHSAIPLAVASGDGLIVLARKKAILTCSAGACDANLVSAATDSIDADSLAADAADEIGAATWGIDATGEQTQGTFGQAIGDPAADTTTIYQAVATDATGDNVAVDVVAMKAETVLIVADTGELQVDDIPTLIAALPTATEIWDIQCEDQAPGYTCREAMSLILAEAAGTAVYTSGTRTWVVKDPSGTETRLTLVYGAELDGDRTTSTPAPFTP